MSAWLLAFMHRREHSSVDRLTVADFNRLGVAPAAAVIAWRTAYQVKYDEIAACREQKSYAERCRKYAASANSVKFSRRADALASP